jgi:hypothetical protein
MKKLRRTVANLLLAVIGAAKALSVDFRAIVSFRLLLRYHKQRYDADQCPNRDPIFPFTSF